MSNNTEGLFDAEQIWKIDRKHLTLKHQIGKGSFGTIQLANYLGTNVAVKTIPHDPSM